MVFHANPPKLEQHVLYPPPPVVQPARSSQVRTGTHYGPGLYMPLVGLAIPDRAAVPVPHPGYSRIPGMSTLSILRGFLKPCHATFIIISCSLHIMQHLYQCNVVTLLRQENTCLQPSSWSTTCSFLSFLPRHETPLHLSKHTSV